MKHTALSPVFGLLPVIGLGGCGMLSGDRTPEVTNAARLSVAMAAEASGDSQMALQIYATALAKDPSDTKAAVQYARALVSNRQIGLARELLSRQLAARPGQPDLSREFGTIEVMQGQAASAVPRFDVALNANPNDVRALVNKGIALDMMGQHLEAQQLYRRADALSPDDAAVRNNLAMSLMLLGRSQEAGDVMQGIAAGNGSSPRMRNNMAVVAAANGDMARARQLTAGEISDVELQSLATQLRSRPQQLAAPLAASPETQAVAAPTERTAPIAAAALPAAMPAADMGVSGAIPLAVPGQSRAGEAGANVTPVSSPAPRAAPNRTQDKRGTGRLNMTRNDAETAVTPAVIARVIEQTMEKEAAFIGEPPSVATGPVLAEGLRVLPAVAVSPLRVRPAVAASLPAADAAPRSGGPMRTGYSVQLASVPTEAGAQLEWRRMNERIPFAMMGRDATVDIGTRADGRSFWRLRTAGFTDLSAARSFCDELKMAGRDCFVTGGHRARAAAAPHPAPSAPVVAPPEASATSATLSPEG